MAQSKEERRIKKLEYMREYNKRPEVKARFHANNITEKRKAYMRDYMNARNARIRAEKAEAEARENGDIIDDSEK